MGLVAIAMDTMGTLTEGAFHADLSTVVAIARIPARTASRSFAQAAASGAKGPHFPAREYFPPISSALGRYVSHMYLRNSLPQQ